MSKVSTPLIALLVGTVVFFALWIVALKPSSSHGGSSSQGLGAYQSAISQAHQAVATANAASARDGAPVSTAQAATAAPAAGKAQPKPKPAVSTATASSTVKAKAGNRGSNASAGVSSATRRNVNQIERALLAHKVLAVLFYNPSAADDQAVKQEFDAVSGQGGKVVKLDVPVSQIAQYSMLTDQVPISGSPTLVLVNRNDQASTVVGYVDPLEISQRIADALAAK